MRRIRSHLTYANVMVTLLAFVVLAGGGAYAANTVFSSDIANNEVYSADVRNDTLSGGGLAAVDLAPGAVRSSEIDNNEIRSADVRNDTLTGGGLTASDLAVDAVGASEVANNSIQGFDVAADTLQGGHILEGTLSTVPRAEVAALGGTGRSSSGGCDPESENYVDCAIVTLNLPRPARVLLIGQVWAQRESDAGFSTGSCELVSNAGFILPSTDVFITTEDTGESVGLTAVTGVQTAGSHDYAVACNQGGLGAITYRNVSISAVALSAD